MTPILFLLAALAPTTQADELATRDRQEAVLVVDDASDDAVYDEVTDLTTEEMLDYASTIRLEQPTDEPDPVYADVLTTCISTDNNVTWSCQTTFIEDCSAHGIDWPVLMLDIGTYQTCTGMA